MKFNLFGGSKTPRQIRLGDLARAFWQERPEDQGAIKDQDAPRSGADPVFENQDIENFWLEYVRPFRSTMTAPMFQAIQALLLEIESLESCSSIAAADSETPRQYRVLSRITLLDHSLTVAREAVDLLRAKENDFQMHAGKILLAALFHDMGKHPSASIANMPHSYTGAVWLQKRIGQLRDREQIVEAVRLHHADYGLKKFSSNNPILPVLVQADRIARRKELARVSVEDQTIGAGQSICPPETDGDPQNSLELDDTQWDAWFSKEKFIAVLRTQITCMGFDGFCFGDEVYFSPSIVEVALNQIRAEQGLAPADFRQDLPRLITSRIPEARNEKYRLRFKDDFKPMKKWFFVFAAADFEPLGESARNHPRDQEGRWLKDLERI